MAVAKYFSNAFSVLGILILFFCSMSVAQENAPKVTLDNLNTVIELEANTSNKYRVFAEKADAEGHPQVAKLFRAISKSEAIHRTNHEEALRKLGGQPRKFDLKQVSIGITQDDLKSVVVIKKHEKAHMYLSYIKQARKDRALPAMEAFVHARESELHHEVLLRQALKHLGKNKKMDYFVNSKTGSVEQRRPGSATPHSETLGGEYIKVE